MAEPTTRERILDVAATLFITQGYDGTSLREIADEMGFTKAALYYHFPSKEDLLRALIEPFTDIAQGMGERLTKAQDVEEWADALAWMVDQALEHLRVFSLLERNRGAVRVLAEDSDFFQDHEHWHEQLEAAIDRLAVTFEDRVRLVCTLAVVAGFDDFGGSPMMESDPDGVREHLGAVTRQILGLPKARRSR